MNTNNPEYQEFLKLKAAFCQAPLAKPRFEMLVDLAKKYDRRMANYLEKNRSHLLFD